MQPPSEHVKTRASETDQFLHLQLYFSQYGPAGKTDQSFSFLSSSSLPLWPLPPGSNAASGLLLPSSLSLLLRWLGGLQGPGSSLPASPSPPASRESLPPASQQQSCLAGSLCLCQPVVPGGTFIDAKLMFHPEFPESLRHHKHLIFLWCVLPIISYDSIGYVTVFNANVKQRFLCAFRNWTSPIITWTIYQLGYSETCPT